METNILLETMDILEKQKEAEPSCIEMYGSFITARYQPIMTSITKILIE